MMHILYHSQFRHIILLALVTMSVLFFSFTTAANAAFCIDGEDCIKKFPPAFWEYREIQTGDKKYTQGSQSAVKNWTVTSIGEVGSRYCIGTLCEPFSPEIINESMTTGERASGNARTTWADINVDVRRHDQIAGWEWGTFKYIYRGANIFPQWNGLWIYDIIEHPERFEYTNERPCGFEQSQVTTEKRILQGGSYRKGSRALQTLSVTDKKATAQYNFHTEYLHTRSGYSLCVLTVWKENGASLQDYFFIEPKKPSPPTVTSFTVNGEAYAQAVDYCTQTTNLAWTTEKANQVTVWGARINQADEKRNDVNGALRGLRPTTDTEYNIIANYVNGNENINLSSEKSSVPVYVYRTQCYEDCALRQAEDSYFAGRARLNATEVRRICLFGLCSDMMLPTQENISLHAFAEVSALALYAQTQGIFTYEGTRDVILELLKGFLIFEEFTKRVSQCSNKLPDESFDITSVYNSVARGAWKGFQRGFIRGLLIGTIGLIGDPCNPMVTAIAQRIAPIIINVLDQQFGNAIAAQFGGIPDPNFPGERMGYEIGDQIGTDVGIATPGAIIAGIKLVAGEKGSVQQCPNPLREDIVDPTPRKDPPPQVSGPVCPNPAGCVASVGEGIKAQAFKDLRQDQADISNTIQTLLQVVGIREIGRDEVGKVGTNDGTWGTENAGKTIVVGTDSYSTMPNATKQAFNRNFIKNVEKRKSERMDSKSAVENEFRYAAGKQGMKQEDVNKYVGSKEFQDIIKLFNY